MYWCCSCWMAEKFFQINLGILRLILDNLFRKNLRDFLEINSLTKVIKFTLKMTVGLFVISKLMTYFYYPFLANFQNDNESVSLLHSLLERFFPDGILLYTILERKAKQAQRWLTHWMKSSLLKLYWLFRDVVLWKLSKQPMYNTFKSILYMRRIFSEIVLL